MDQINCNKMMYISFYSFLIILFQLLIIHLLIIEYIHMFVYI